MKAKSRRTELKADRKEQALTLSVLSADGRPAAVEVLDEAIAGLKTHQHLLWQYETGYQANNRVGTASVKDRGEVSGGGKKPWRQKGTGRARHGSTRSPIWTKGGVTFGPTGRKHGARLSREVRRRSLLASLRLKAKHGRLYLVDAFEISSGKTKEAAALLKGWGLERPVIIRESRHPETERAMRNLNRATTASSQDVSAHDVLAAGACVMTRVAYRNLITRGCSGSASPDAKGKAS